MTARKIVHIEIPSTQHNQAKSFYSKLCGWGVEEVPFDDNNTYVTFKTGNVDVALSTVSDTNPIGNVILYFESDDLDSDMAQVKALGGTVEVPRQDIAGYGALGVFLDPMGNRVAFWQSNHPD